MPQQLTMIGTVHRDPEGYPRLSRLLQLLRPDRITLEMSRFALDYRQSRSRTQRLRLERILVQLAVTTGRPYPELAAHPAIRDILALLALPFEYQAAVEYCQEHSVTLSLVDSSEISARKLGRVNHGLISRRNLEILLNLPQPDGSANETESYLTAHRLLNPTARPTLRMAYLAGRRGEEGIGPRDQSMAKQICRVWQQTEGHLLHIGGWVHLIEDEQGETLYTRLSHLHPRRLLLDTQPAVANPSS